MRAVRTAKSVKMLAARSKVEWTASLRMPRLPVSRPTTSLPSTMARPMNTEAKATSSGRLANDFIDPTLVVVWAAPGVVRYFSSDADLRS